MFWHLHSPLITRSTSLSGWWECSYARMLLTLSWHWDKAHLSLPLLGEHTVIPLVSESCHHHHVINAVAIISVLPYSISCSEKWQRVRTVQMFVEHVIIKHEGLETFGKRLKFVSELLKCFSSAPWLTFFYLLSEPEEGVWLQDWQHYSLCAEYLADYGWRAGEEERVLLINMHFYVLTHNSHPLFTLRFDKEKLLSIRESCKGFFMELVSTLCFGQSSLPEEKLIKRLLNIVFTAKSTKDFTYSDDAAADKLPVIRSFLLQLLLEHESVLADELWSNGRLGNM